MTTINLKDFYPWYTHDEYIEVSDEVAEELWASRRREAAKVERENRKFLCCSKMKIFYKPFGVSDVTIEKVQGGKTHEERNENGSP